MLLVALLPTLTFIGHWELRLDIPGTGYFVGAEATPEHADHDDGHDHSQHCHDSVASCSDVPATAGATVAMLQSELLSLHLGGMLHRAWQAESALPAGGSSLPELQPPRPITALTHFA